MTSSGSDSLAAYCGWGFKRDPKCHRAVCSTQPYKGRWCKRRRRVYMEAMHVKAYSCRVSEGLSKVSHRNATRVFGTHVQLANAINITKPKERGCWSSGTKTLSIQ